MKIIGRIDRNIYCCVASELVTDEVILTEERVRHIMQRHPGDYERFFRRIPEMIADPDYILQDDRPGTAMVMKEFSVEGDHFRLALRLVTPADDPTLKNSVLTFMKVRKKEYSRLLRNKKILYKKA